MVKLRGFGNEEFYRRCGVCRENEICNFCRYIPIDKSKHTHQFNCTEQSLQSFNWFQKKILRKKELTIKKLCICGEEKNE